MLPKKVGRGRGSRLKKEQQRLPRPGESSVSPSEDDNPLHRKIPEPRPESEENTHASVEALGMHLNQLSRLGSSLAKRPDYGSRGKGVRLFVNYYPVELPSGYVYHYDVDIYPKRRVREGDIAAKPHHSSERTPYSLNKKRKREVFNLMLQACDKFKNVWPAYDGQNNMYTRSPLAMAPLTVTVGIPGDPTDAATGGGLPSQKDMFEVSIKPVCKKDKSCAISLDTIHAFFEGKTNDISPEAVMAIDAVLRSGPSFKYVPLGKSFFYPPLSARDVHPLGGGKEIWFGYHQSLRFAQWKPVVNINVTATTFHRAGPVINYICEVLNCNAADLYRIPQLRDSEVALISKKLKGLKIKTTHSGYVSRVLRVTREAANRLSFPMETQSGTVMKKVSDYFLERYKVKLKYPQLPCLQATPEARNVFLPLEVCEVVKGQPTNREKLTETQSRDMIKVTALTPAQRFNELQRVHACADFNNDPWNKQFGIRVSSNPMGVDGRVIPSPPVLYSDKRQVIPNQGSWDIRGQQFFRAAELDNWLILSFVREGSCSRRSLENFAHKLCSVAQRYGINLRRPVEVRICNGGNSQPGDVLRDVLRTYENLHLAVIVLPGRKTKLHSEVKKAAENELGLVTQCVTSETAEKSQDAVLSKLCQKINTKMGGINSTLRPDDMPAMFKKPVIVIGADVNHPPPNAAIDGKPSLAAAVGSLDAYLFRYAVTCRAQRPTDENKKALEVIADLKNMVVELLKAFYKHTRGKKPEKIIFYRDGVSEGQFLQVLEEEVSAIQRACRVLESDYEPGITFIVVQKRHHTRFIPQDESCGVGQKKNVAPGTIVDTGATSRINFDFFLCSHFGLQGTSRPGHYTVLFDGNDFTSDELQKMTYYFCHVYARCTSSIRIPVPVVYADLAAFRAREYLDTLSGGSDSSSEGFGGDLKNLRVPLQEAIAVTPNLKDTMYFV